MSAPHLRRWSEETWGLRGKESDGASMRVCARNGARIRSSVQRRVKISDRTLRSTALTTLTIHEVLIIVSHPSALAMQSLGSLYGTCRALATLLLATRCEGGRGREDERRGGYVKPPSYGCPLGHQICLFLFLHPVILRGEGRGARGEGRGATLATRYEGGRTCPWVTCIGSRKVLRKGSPPTQRLPGRRTHHVNHNPEVKCSVPRPPARAALQLEQAWGGIHCGREAGNRTRSWRQPFSKPPRGRGKNTAILPCFCRLRVTGSQTVFRGLLEVHT